MHDTVEEKPAVEYIAGRPFRKVSPKRTHAVVQLALGIILNRCAASRGVIGPEWRFKLSRETELVPDMAFVSYERLRPLTEAQAEEPPFAPDVAAEVRSPSHRAGLASEKIRLYLAHGAQLVLDVDPARRSVDAYAQQGVHRHFKSGDGFGMEVVPWLLFDVDELFANLKIPR